MDDDTMIRDLGSRVRLLRTARGRTLAQLAADAGLSHPFLSKLERGLARPSMASLTRIAQALGTSQLELLAGPGTAEPGAAHVVRAGEGTSGGYGLGHARLLVAGRRLQPFTYTGDNDEPGDYFAHAEDEFVLVTEGTLALDLGAQGTTSLAAGDSVYLCGGAPHRWSSPEGRTYRLFIVKESPAR